MPTSEIGGDVPGVNEVGTLQAGQDRLEDQAKAFERGRIVGAARVNDLGVRGTRATLLPLLE
jgi:hypothetical protein